MFVAVGGAPSAEEVSTALDLPADEVLAGWRRLDGARALVLHAAGTGIRMPNPFSAVLTSYRVEVDERWWYANCA